LIYAQLAINLKQKRFRHVLDKFSIGSQYVNPLVYCYS